MCEGGFGGCVVCVGGFAVFAGCWEGGGQRSKWGGQEGRTCASDEYDGNVSYPFVGRAELLSYLYEPFQEFPNDEEAAGEVCVERLVPLSEGHCL